MTLYQNQAGNSQSNSQILKYKQNSKIILDKDLEVTHLELGNETIKVNNEEDIYLLSLANITEKQNDVYLEHQYFITRYETLLKFLLHKNFSKKEQHKHPTYQHGISLENLSELFHIREVIIKKEMRIKTFYDTLAKYVKKFGYLSGNSNSVYDSGLYNCKSIGDLRIDLTSENKAKRDMRVIGALAILPAVGFALPDITRELFSGGLSIRHTLTTAIFMFIIGLIIVGTEYYRNRKINKVSKGLIKLLSTQTNKTFNFYHLKVAHSHVISLRIAINNIITEYNKIYPEYGLNTLLSASEPA